MSDKRGIGSGAGRWQLRGVSQDPPTSQPRLAGLDPSALIRLGIASQPTAAAPVLPGYEIFESLGRGGMGEVFRARQQSLGREVAVKVLRADLPASGWLPERFEREARTMAALRHPHVVTVHDALPLADGRMAIVMEFIRSGTLRLRLQAAPHGLPPHDALTWARQIAAGLGAAHAAGIVHRDVKPENVLIDDHGVARVSDFGMAFSTDAGSTRYTQTGAALGTLGYMAPEQLRGQTADARSDIFSVGVILYEMLTGRLPQGSFSPVSELRRDISARVDVVIRKCLRPDPDERPASAAELCRMLEDLERPASFPRWTRRRAIGALTFAGLGVAAGSGWWLMRRAPVPEAEWRRLAWPATPEAAAIKGGWRIDGDALLSDEQVCILPVAATMPPAFRLRLRFIRISGDVSVGIFLRTARGMVVATLAGRRLDLGGLQLVDGKALEEGDSFTLKILNGRAYEWEIEIRPERVKMWVDGELKQDAVIAGKVLAVPETWAWTPEPDAAAVLLGSWQSAVRFERLEWKVLEER